jgi:rhodanese-related sulfurtransferase
MRKFIVIILAILAGLSLSACAGSNFADNDVKTDVLAGSTISAADTGLVNTAKAQAMLSEKAATGLQLLDVRTPEEFQAGCLSSAKNVDIRSGSFEQQISGLDKNGSYLVYCRTGKRSADARSRMLSDGFKNVVDLQGGITEWQAQGLPVSIECK